MRQAGEVTYADAHKPRRNEGCVEFASERVSHFIKDFHHKILQCGKTRKLLSPFFR